jgi:hypothetical protein
MSIPESQLDTWSHQGSVTQSKNTYATIRNVLEDTDSPYASRQPKIYLQGSYCNDTNIYSESDVDIVICLESCFQNDLESLPQPQKDAFNAAYPDATYTHVQFKKDVLSHLQATFDAAVKPGNKAVKIEASGSRRSADVLICVQFRRYHRFNSIGDQEYDVGVCFYDGANTRIANYPKQHSDNCTAKHKATNARFKPLVRILKNMRTKLVADGVLSSGIAPSYYLEGLLYNVPNGKFGGTYEDAVVNSLNWILGEDRSQFVCANEQYYLLRDGTQVTWTSADCDKFLTAVVELWKNW